MQAWASAAPFFVSHAESWAKPASLLEKVRWRSLPLARTRQALNFSFAKSRPRGSSDMVVLLAVRRRASLAHAGSARDGAAMRYCPAFGGAHRLGGAGGLISPAGSAA